MSQPIAFTCPKCHYSAGVASYYAGQSGRCPSCGTAIEVPDPSSDGGEGDFQTPNRPIPVTCPNCHYCGEVPSCYAGQSGGCPSCGTTLEVPRRKSGKTWTKSEVREALERFKRLAAKARRKPFQFTLPTLLVCMTVCALLFGVLRTVMILYDRNQSVRDSNALRRACKELELYVDSMEGQWPTNWMMLSLARMRAGGFSGTDGFSDMQARVQIDFTTAVPKPGWPAPESNYFSLNTDRGGAEELVAELNQRLHHYLLARDIQGKPLHARGGEAKTTLLLRRGERLLGTLTFDDTAPRRFRYRFQTTAEFARVQDLFAEDLRLLRAGGKEAWESAHRAVEALGLTLHPAEGSRPIRRFRLHISGDRAWLWY